jgi:subtilase family serine protease
VRRPALLVLLFAALLAAVAVGPAAPRAAADPGGVSALHSHRHARVCGTPAPHAAACHAIVDLDVAGPLVAAATPSGYGPADLQRAYNLAGLSGGGRTVAIVDAYDLPTAQADLNTYRAQYGLPACGTGCFTKVNQTGGSTPPAANAGWGQEIALDLDMVSAACPGCKILLVEANSASMTDLGTAVNTAVRLGAVAVSNSYGGSESSADTSYDTSYYNHPGVAITVSSGDSGYGVEYPAASQYVTAVGGTTLTADGSARGFSESAWSGAGSGCSAYDPKPAWQHDTSCTRRTVADVSAVADPATGVAVYDSTASGGQSGWLVFGGTSAASPLVAATYALAGTPAAGTTPASFPYASAGNLYDVTSGSNGSCGGTYLCTAQGGYDGPTGLGTPHGTAAFTAGGTTPPPPPTATQLLGNPGFETGSAAPWTTTAGVVDSSTGEPAHSGSWKAWLNGYGTTHTDRIAQTVTIPSTATTATLSYWLHVDTAETTTTTAYDKLSVQLVNGSGTVLATVGSFSNLSRNSGYAQRTADVSAYRGQTVTVRFTGTEDSSLQTSFVVDDTALTVQ